MHRRFRTIGPVLTAVVVLAASGLWVAGPGRDPAGRASESPIALVLPPVPPNVRTTPVPAGQLLHLALVMASKDPRGLSRALAAVSNPESPAYRHFISSAEFDEAYGAAPGAVRTVEAYLAANGGTDISTTPDGLGVLVDLPARAVPALVGATPVEFDQQGLREYTLSGPPRLTSTLSGEVVNVDGLAGTLGSTAPFAGASHGTASVPRLGQFVVDGLTRTKWYIGSDFVQAYDEPPLFPGGGYPNASFPTHAAVATILMSGYNATSGVNLAPFDPSGVDQYFNDTFPASWPRPNVSGVPVTVNGIIPPLPGPPTSLNDTTFNVVENSLDLEMAGSTAPGAKVVNFYFAANQFQSGSASAIESSADLFADTLAAALAYNYSPETLTAVSNSYGLPDLNDTLWNEELQKAQLMGVTVLAASGDQGNAPTSDTGLFQGQWPPWPGSAAFDDYGVVAVGGTTIDLSGNSTGTYSPPILPIAFDSNISGIQSEITWYDTLAGQGHYSGSEGGASEVIAEPVWQFQSAAQWPIVNATSLQGLGVLDRAEPDVSLTANDTLLYLSGSALTGVNFTVVQGTSISSPLLAGLVAEWATVSGHRFGDLSPELYRIGSYAWTHDQEGSPFHQIVHGGNYYFGAGAGWNPTTGWGSVNATAFVEADANSTIANYVYTGPTPGLPPPGGSNSNPYSLSTSVLLAIGIGLTITAAIVLVVGRPRTPPRAPTGVTSAYPPGVAPLPGAGAPPANRVPTTFSCPYCGAERPAEPVRCPSCGTL